MKRGLIVLGAVVAGWITVYAAGMALLVHSMTQADPYPTFMSAYQSSGSPTYVGAKRAFSDFVAKTFPIGSRESDAIAQIAKGGFQVTSSSPDSVELAWQRHAGPCSESYSIVVSGDADGKIAKIAGRLIPVCL